MNPAVVIATYKRENLPALVAAILQNGTRDRREGSSTIPAILLESAIVPWRLRLKT